MMMLLRDPIGRLRVMGWVEGITLITLLGVAVPMKRLLGAPELVSIIGPIHGATFIAYLTLASATVFGGGWSARDITRVLGASVMPFGTFLNDGLLTQKQTEMPHV